MVLNLIKSVSLRGLFVALFLMPSFAFASNGYQVSVASGIHSSQTQACDAYLAERNSIGWYLGKYAFFAEPNYCRITANSDGTGSVSTTKDITLISVSCSTFGEGWTDDGTGQCTDAPVVTCNLGDILYSNAQLTAITSDPKNFGGCEFVQNQRISCVYSPSDTETMCMVKWQSTGETSDLPVTQEGTPEQVVIADGQTSKQEPSTSETQVSTPTTNTDPDGTVTTNENVTTTKNTGGSTVVTESDEFIFVKDSTGTTTVYQKDVTTISNPDGSSTVQETKGKSTTPPNTENTSVPKNGSGAPTTVVTNGDTIIDNSVTTTNNYAADGTLTSSESSSETGNEETLDEEGDTVYTQSDGQGSFDDATVAVLSDIEQAKTDLLTTFNQIKSEASTLISFNHSGSGSLPCPPAVSLGSLGEFDVCMAGKESELAFLSAVILLIAAFASLVIILR
jgi:hypothetical protein